MVKRPENIAAEYQEASFQSPFITSVHQDQQGCNDVHRFALRLKSENLVMTVMRRQLCLLPKQTSQAIIIELGNRLSLAIPLTINIMNAKRFF